MKFILKAITFLVIIVIGVILSLYFSYIVKDLADAFTLTYIQNLSLSQVYGYAFIVGLLAAMPGAISRFKKIHDLHEKTIGKFPFADKMAESFAVMITSAIILSMSWGIGHIVAKIIM